MAAALPRGALEQIHRPCEECEWGEASKALEPAHFIGDARWNRVPRLVLLNMSVSCMVLEGEKETRKGQMERGRVV